MNVSEVVSKSERVSESVIEGELVYEDVRQHVNEHKRVRG